MRKFSKKLIYIFIIFVSLFMILSNNKSFAVSFSDPDNFPDNDCSHLITSHTLTVKFSHLLNQEHQVELLDELGNSLTYSAESNDTYYFRFPNCSYCQPNPAIQVSLFMDNGLVLKSKIFYYTDVVVNDRTIDLNMLSMKLYNTPIPFIAAIILLLLCGIILIRRIYLLIRKRKKSKNPKNIRVSHRADIAENHNAQSYRNNVKRNRRARINRSNVHKK